MSYNASIEGIMRVENDVFINTDDSIIKACEEHTEFVEALQTKDTENIIDEAADAIINTLVATKRVCGTIPEEYDFLDSLDIVQNTINQGKWVGDIQTLRQRYTRKEKTITPEQVLARTKTYVSGILTQIEQIVPDLTLDHLIAHSTQKITGRMEQYLPEINLDDYITDRPNFPKPGILFKDIAPLLASNKASRYVTDQLASWIEDADVVVGLDARGFLFGKAAADQAGKPFIMGRKPGKMPGELYSIDYGLEYGTNTLTIQKDAIQPGQKVAIIDDLLATGGSADAAAQLIEQAGGIVEGQYFVIELDGLAGREKLTGKVKSMLHY